MPSSESPSVHDEDDIPESSDGWAGGDLVNTGGGLFARMWVHPERGVRVGYSVDEPDAVGVERVSFGRAGEKSNPLMWNHVEDLQSESCNGEDDCLETALRLMKGDELGGD